jgi:hypothetical protein
MPSRSERGRSLQSAGSNPHLPVILLNHNLLVGINPEKAMEALKPARSSIPLAFGAGTPLISNQSENCPIGNTATV